MLKRTAVCFILLISLIETTCAARPFIIDTDMGVDDVIAILYLLKRPDIDIKAITITANGSVHCQPALQNARGLLKLMDKTDIPLACNQKKSLVGQHRYPASILEESNTLAGTAKLLPLVKPLASGDAVDLIIKTLKQSSHPVTILAIGPLTNIAQALQKQPDIKNQIQAIYIMGGAVNVPGNINAVDKTIDNNVAEWNIYLDPLAADTVFKQNIPLVLVSLDVTNQLPVDMPFYERVKKKHITPEAGFIFALLSHNMKMLTTNEWYFWDPLAAVIATNESIASFEYQPIKIELTPEKLSGATRIHLNEGRMIRVVTRVDEVKFKEILLKHLNS